MRCPRGVLIVVTLLCRAELASAIECDDVLEQEFADAERRHLLGEECHDGLGPGLPYLDAPVGPTPSSQPDPPASVTHLEVSDIPPLGCTATTWAQEPPPSEEGLAVGSPFDCLAAGKVTECPGNAPLPLVRVEAAYPPTAAQRGIEGWVELEATLSSEGEIVEPGILASAPKGVFDDTALEAFRRWKYTGTLDGPTAMRVRICFQVGQETDEP
jgi:TonB family protein